MTFNPAPKRTAPRKPKSQTPKRKAAPRKRNPQRKAKRLETDFGGAEYADWIGSFSCAICDVRGHTVAAHLKARGAGGKAKDIAPLCSTRLSGGVWIQGCHEKWDDHDPEIRRHEDRLRDLATAMREYWLSSSTPFAWKP